MWARSLQRGEGDACGGVSPSSVRHAIHNLAGGNVIEGISIGRQIIHVGLRPIEKNE